MQGQQFYEIYYVVWNHDLDVWSSENIASASFCILMNFKDVNDETVEIRPTNGRSENEMWEKYVWNLWEFGFYLNFPNLKLNISVSREMFDLFIDFFFIQLPTNMAEVLWLVTSSNDTRCAHVNQFDFIFQLNLSLRFTSSRIMIKLFHQFMITQESESCDYMSTISIWNYISNGETNNYFKKIKFWTPNSNHPINRNNFTWHFFPIFRLINLAALCAIWHERWQLVQQLVQAAKVHILMDGKIFQIVPMFDS